MISYIVLCASDLKEQEVVLMMVVVVVVMLVKAHGL